MNWDSACELLMLSSGMKSSGMKDGALTEPGRTLSTLTEGTVRLLKKSNSPDAEAV